MPAFKLFGGSVHAALIHAATRYDEKESHGNRYNPYALAQYFMRIDDIDSDIARGADPAEAIIAGTHGSLRTALLRAIGHKADHRQLNRVTYQPVKNN